jgi:23S rRNA (cytidine1920-2'-O)/16S rRNA (cytidine1409-2'-O)-methyltransferase
MSEKFVSRAGEKLEYALEQFKISVAGKICADFGASTGGFVDCMLKRGAEKVYAIETGYGTLDWKLRNDARVVVMERTNALHAELPELMDFISIDVSWTPQKLILPQALKYLKDGGEIVSLLKPHYEAKKEWLKAGTIKDEFIEPAVEKVKEELKELGMKIKEITKSPIVGKKGGNPEYLLWIKK